MSLLASQWEYRGRTDLPRHLIAHRAGDLWEGRAGALVAFYQEWVLGHGNSVGGARQVGLDREEHAQPLSQTLLHIQGLVMLTAARAMVIGQVC